MKKIILTDLFLLMAFAMSAVTYTNQVSITLDDNVQYYQTLVVGESDDLKADSITNGYAAEIQNINEHPVSIYAVFDGVKYSSIAMKNLVNLPVGIKTSNSTSYTLYFDDLIGTIQLYDAQYNGGDVVTITEGGTYNFTIAESEKNSLITNRFFINYSRTPDEGEFAACHQYGKLTINNNPFTGNIVIRNTNGDIVLNEVSTNTPQYIDLSALTTTGHYTVEVMEADGVTVGKTFIISIR